MAELSSILARHVAQMRYETLPPATVTATKRSLLDALGVTLAASSLVPECMPFVKYARESRGKPESSIIGFPGKVPAAMAAFANGSMAHALDFEDAYDRAPVHPNAPAVPAALAAAQARGKARGKELITALATGCDLVCRLTLGLTENPDEFGWYYPPIWSAFGAATAAAKLLDLNEAQIIDAFSLVLGPAACSGELKRSPDSHMRAVRDAFAAQAGVVAAILAQKGVRGFDRPLEGEAGLFNLYARGCYRPDRILESLGHKFEGENISFKAWPSCRGTHAFIESALILKRKFGIEAENIQDIHVVGGPIHRMLFEPETQRRQPKTAIDAKFSIPFTVATALIHDAVTLGHFSPLDLRNEAVLSLGRRVSYEIIPEPSGEQEAVGGRLEIRMADGRAHSNSVIHPYGHPENPLDEASFIAKFFDCAAYASNQIQKIKLDRIVEAVQNLEAVQDVDRELCAYFS
jgi:2-methylcitrate dehydratase PrpD